MFDFNKTFINRGKFLPLGNSLSAKYFNIALYTAIVQKMGGEMEFKCTNYNINWNIDKRLYSILAGQPGIYRRQLIQLNGA